MIQEIIIHAPEFTIESDYIHREIESNLAGKLDAYIRRSAHDGDKIRTELTLTRDKIGISGKLEVSFPGYAFRSSRDNYAKLDDLINHLFVHIKEQMGK